MMLNIFVDNKAVQKVKKIVKKIYPNASIHDRRKLESLIIGDFIFGFIAVFYVITQYRSNMDAFYLIYFIGHSITAFGFLLSLILVLIKRKNLAVWALYCFFLGTSIATLIVPTLQQGDYYFYMFNYIFFQTSLLMLFLYLNIVTVQKFHHLTSFIVVVLDSLIVIIYYVYVGSLENTGNIISVFLPVFLGFLINVTLISGLHHHQIDELKKNQAEIERLLGKSQSRVDIFEKILPICSHCKTIRNKEGEWIQIENYIRDHSKFEFSHGICPKCHHKYYSEYLD